MYIDKSLTGSKHDKLVNCASAYSEHHTKYIIISKVTTCAVRFCNGDCCQFFSISLSHVYNFCQKWRAEAFENEVRYVTMHECVTDLSVVNTQQALCPLRLSHLGISPRVAFQGSVSGKPRANQN